MALEGEFDRVGARTVARVSTEIEFGGREDPGFPPVGAASMSSIDGITDTLDLVTDKEEYAHIVVMCKFRLL